MKVIKADPYGCLVYLTDDLKEFSRVYKKWTGNAYGVNHGSEGLTFNNHDGNYLVGIFKNDPNVVAHEVAHVCLMISDRVGYNNMQHEQEPFCYLMGHLVGETTRLLKPRGNTK